MDDNQWISLIPQDQLPDDLQLMAQKWKAVENGDTNFIQTVSHAPETLRKYIRWSSPMWRKGYLQHRIKELCRIRIANSNECRYCMTMRYETGKKQGINDTLTDQLADFESGDFSVKEKAALRYTDEIYMDDITWQGRPVADDVYERLAGQFTESEIVELTWAISIAIEYGRNFTVWGVPPSETKSIADADTIRNKYVFSANTKDEEANLRRLRAVWEEAPYDGAALSTLLTKHQMLGQVLTYYDYIMNSGLLDSALKDAVRDRILELDSGIIESRAHQDHSPRTRAALAWAEGMATDFRVFLDDTAMLEQLRQHFSEPEIVELGMFTGFRLALRRIGAVLGDRVSVAKSPVASAS